MLWPIIFGVFIVLHGLIHLLYFGQSRRLFELQPGLLWPDGSWAFSRFLGDDVTRFLASVACMLAAIGLIAGGAGLLLKQTWWHTVVTGSAALSAALFILFWDGQMQRLDEKGAVGLLLSIAILVVVLVLQWPD
jgi:hypothetical protein